MSGIHGHIRRKRMDISSAWNRRGLQNFKKVLKKIIRNNIGHDSLLSLKCIIKLIYELSLENP